ncbi:MAG: hypothetical protein CMB80_01825 [Flammeovirgaceae bacterium]|nr:hypothetical protein [Flammeovirgaceae bacterium]
MKKLICYFFGHNYIKTSEHDTGYYKYTQLYCQRCGVFHESCFDYGKMVAVNTELPGAIKYL